MNGSSDAASAAAAAASAQDLVAAAQGLPEQKKQALVEQIWEQELLVLNKLLDGKALQDHLEGNYLRALTLAFSAGALSSPSAAAVTAVDLKKP